MALMNESWEAFLKNEWKQAYFLKLSTFLNEQYNTHNVYPKKEDVFSAFGYASYLDCKVVILGQDPYHRPNQAHGLSFSVKQGVPIPPSLKNIYKELKNDCGIDEATTGSLVPWAKQGVLMINAVLTVSDSHPTSHRNQGWEIFTDHVFEKLNNHPEPIVFVLWGKNAQQKERLITNKKHYIIKSAHPSPLSAYRGFFDSKPFSRINTYLKEANRQPIDWRLK
jgi:uracil-DNA glycosylase